MQQSKSDSPPAAIECGMLVGTVTGKVGRVIARYRYASPSVPGAGHRRVKLQIGAKVTDIRESEVSGRISYGRAPLRVIVGGRH